MRSLVTGAAGFAGKALVRHLLAKGVPVRAMVRSDDAAAELASMGAEPVLADLTKHDSLRAAVQGVTNVYHIAAAFRQAGVPASFFHEVNVDGTRALLDHSIEARVERFIHCSTVGVLGNIEEPPGDELTPYNPGDPYQISKAEGEKLVLDYFRRGKISGSVVRPAMIWGPDDRRTLKLFKRISERTFFYVGPGTALVHFVDVRDLAKAFHLVSESPRANGEIFIVAGQSCLPLVELNGIIASILGVPEPWLHLPVRPMQMAGSMCEAVCTPFGINPPIFRRRVDFFTKNRSFNCAKAHELLGFVPSQPLVAELIDIIKSYLDSGAIAPSRLGKPSTMLRTVEGKICLWDEGARDVYGWNREHAVGNVSHSLLSTVFPEDIENINRSLHRRGLWRGRLLHRNRAGNELQVISNWRLVRTQPDAEPMVLEINVPDDEPKYRRRIGGIRGSTAFAALQSGWCSGIAAV